MRRAAVLTLVAAVVIGLAPAAGAVTSEEIKARREARKARIECMRAEMRGEPCAPVTAVRAKAAPRAGTGQRVIEISISEQTLRAWEGNRVAFATPVSTGKGSTPTPRGRFSVLSKERNHWSTKYKVWMPYAMRVVGGIFIHEVPVTTDGRRIGTNALGAPVSGGCIRVGIGPAAALYNWAQIGTPVLIR